MSKPKVLGWFIPLTTAERKRIEAMAKRSEVTLAHWLKMSVLSACSIDEAHWAELDERVAIRADIDPTQFGRLSVQLRNLPSSTVDVLIDAMVLERAKGRREGSVSAQRLAALRKA